MKTMSILLKKSTLEISYISRNSHEYICDYIDFLLYPYIKLGFFKFNSYTNCRPAIDGAIAPQKILDLLKHNINFHQESPIHSYFNKNNVFLNGESLCFFISLDEYHIIQLNTEEYFIFYTNIYD